MSTARLAECSESSVHRWRKAYQQEGEKGLAVKPNPGRPRKLPPAKEQQLVQTLQGWQVERQRQAGPVTPERPLFSYIITTRRVRRFIEEQLGTKFSHTHVYRVLNRLGWRKDPPEGWYPISEEDDSPPPARRRHKQSRSKRQSHEAGPKKLSKHQALQLEDALKEKIRKSEQIVRKLEAEIERKRNLALPPEIYEEQVKERKEARLLTTQAVCQIIRRKFGVRYSKRAASLFLKEGLQWEFRKGLGWRSKR